MEKKLHIEAIRIFAAFWVIFNHTGTFGFTLFSLRDPSQLSYWVYLFIAIFCKVSVPLYFMITGALLLKKDLSSKSLIKKISRISIALLLISIVHFYMLPVFSSMSFTNIPSIFSFLIELYKGRICYHLWYLYAYISLLLTVPFLRCLAKEMSNKMYVYMFVIVVISGGIIPIFQYLICKNEYMISSHINTYWLSSLIVFYPLLGYYLENKFDIEKYTFKKAVLCIIISIASILLVSYLSYFKQINTENWNESVFNTYLFSLIMFPTSTIYITTKKIFSKIKLPEIANKILISVGSCTFGIYLIHVVVKTFLERRNLPLILLNVWNLNDMFAMLLYSAIVFLVCLFITLIMKKIPYLNRII